MQKALFDCFMASTFSLFSLSRSLSRSLSLSPSTFLFFLCNNSNSSGGVEPFSTPSWGPRLNYCRCPLSIARSREREKSLNRFALDLKRSEISSIQTFRMMPSNFCRVLDWRPAWPDGYFIFPYFQICNIKCAQSIAKNNFKDGSTFAKY